VTHAQRQCTRNARTNAAFYLKAIMQDSTGLPTDLREQAQDNRFFAQYCPAKDHWLCRPHQLPGTDLSYAFEQA
jgi:hypothetical protein